DIDHGADRFAKAAGGGQLVAAEGVEPAIVAGDQELVGGLRMEREGRAVAFLELVFPVERIVAAGAPDPALGRDDDGDRRLFDHRVHREFARGRGLGEGGAAAAEGGLGAVFLAQGGEIALEAGALSSSLWSSSCSARISSRSLRSSISSSLRNERRRMLRMASAWRSVSPNSAI